MESQVMFRSPQNISGASAEVLFNWSIWRLDLKCKINIKWFHTAQPMKCKSLDVSGAHF